MAGSPSVSLTAHLPAANIGHKGFLIRVVYKLSNLDIAQPSCPKGDTEQKLPHKPAALPLPGQNTGGRQALSEAFICLRNVSLSPMAESCKLRAVHVEPERLRPPNLSLQISWPNVPSKSLRDFEGFILFITQGPIGVLRLEFTM